MTQHFILNSIFSKSGTVLSLYPDHSKSVAAGNQRNERKVLTMNLMNYGYKEEKIKVRKMSIAELRLWYCSGTS